MHTNTLQQETHRNHIHFDKGYLIAGGIPALLFLITKGLTPFRSEALFQH